MRKRDWLRLVAAPFLGAILLDQGVKTWIRSTVSSPIHLGFFSVSIHENYGGILGVGANIPAPIKILTLTTIAGFLLLAFAILQTLITRRYPCLRIGLSVFAGGVIGNAYDRLANDYTLDYLSIRMGTVQSPVFNLADAFQWLGFGLIIYGLVRYWNQLYPKHEKRARFLINPRFQLRFFLSFLVVSLGFAAISGFFSFAYLRLALDRFQGQAQFDLLRPFVLAYTIIIVVSVILAGVFAIRISHRIVGPMRAVERYLEKRLAGEESRLSFRDGDELSHLQGVIRLLEKLHVTRPAAGSKEPGAGG